MKGLMVHCGGFETDRETVEAVPVPLATAERSRWCAVPYARFLDEIDSACERARVPVLWEDARYALNRDGAQLFGIAPIRVPGLDEIEDWSPMIGFRQSYDSSMAAGLTMGNVVFVCDNMSMCGEFSVSAKNTLEVLEVLPMRLAEAAEKMFAWASGMAGEIGLMKRIHPASWEVDHILVESVRRGIIPGSKIAAIAHEIIEPSYKYHETENGGSPSMWRTFNAFTCAQRDRSPMSQFKTGTPLLNLFREHGLRERRVELTAYQRAMLEEMEAETAEVLSTN